MEKKGHWFWKADKHSEIIFNNHDFFLLINRQSPDRAKTPLNTNLYPVPLPEQISVNTSGSDGCSRCGTLYNDGVIAVTFGVDLNNGVGITDIFNAECFKSLKSSSFKEKICYAHVFGSFQVFKCLQATYHHKQEKNNGL